MTVITDEQIQRSAATSLPQLLSRQPGITVRDASGNPGQQVDIRGFEAYQRASQTRAWSRRPLV